MSNYSKTTDFAAKDSLATGDPGKVIVGTEIDNEFDALETAVNSKANTASPTFTGTVVIPTIDCNAGSIDAVAITASTVDNTTIGATTASTGVFTTLSLSTGFISNINFSGINGEIRGNATAGYIVIAGNTTAAGAWIQIYGDTHASKPNEIEFYSGATRVFSIDPTLTLIRTDNNDIQIGNGTFASAGAVRLPNTAEITWRNAGNTADISVLVNASDEVAFEVGGTEEYAFSSTQADFNSNNIVNVGSITATSFIGSVGTVASTGEIRLANTDGIYWRNAGDTGNANFRLDSSDVFKMTFPLGEEYSFDNTQANWADKLLIRPVLKDYAVETNNIGTLNGAETFNIENGNYQYGTCTGAVTWTFSNPTASGDACWITLEITNGGAGAQTWPGSVDWGGIGAPTLNASGVDILTFVTRDGGTTWRGIHSWTD